MEYRRADQRLYQEWLRRRVAPQQTEEEEPMQYDREGRPKANKTYFGRNGLPWEDDEIEYLNNWYHAAGPEEMGYALERTPNAVRQKAITMGITGK